MPKFVPSILFDDCWGSIGDLTFYHVDGRCYYKKKSRCAFPGTAPQIEQLALHKRALAAWRTLSQETQNRWHEYGRGALSHKPPFDRTTYISGHNLFVSAYHGFALLGDEHMPCPLPFDSFPIHAVEFLSAERENDADLKLRFTVSFENCLSPERYHLLMKIYLTRPGGGKKPGLMHNHLALQPCCSGNSTVEFLIRDYRTVSGLDLNEYTIHCRHLLLDRKTGYRDIYSPLSFSISL